MTDRIVVQVLENGVVTVSVMMDKEEVEMFKVIKEIMPDEDGIETRYTYITNNEYLVLVKLGLVNIG